MDKSGKKVLSLTNLSISICFYNQGELLVRTLTIFKRAFKTQSLSFISILLAVENNKNIANSMSYLDFSLKKNF